MEKNVVPVLYKERVLPSLAFFLALLFLPVAVVAIVIPFSDVIAITSAAASYLVAAAATWFLAPLIVLQQGSLRVGSAVIPVQYLGAAFVISNQDAFAERGRNLNPRAFTRFQIGVNQLVKIEITDLEDPTPYWLISTRNPELLVSFLRKVS